MRRFLRWLLGIQDFNNDQLLELQRRLDDHDDDIEHLGRRFTRLQGQVTRSWRDENEVASGDDDDIDWREMREHGS